MSETIWMDAETRELLIVYDKEDETMSIVLFSDNSWTEGPPAYYLYSDIDMVYIGNL